MNTHRAEDRVAEGVDADHEDGPQHKRQREPQRILVVANLVGGAGARTTRRNMSTQSIKIRHK